MSNAIVNAEAISATGSPFLMWETSSGGALANVPVFKPLGSDDSGTAHVAVAGTVAVTKSGAWDVSISGTALVAIMNTPTVSAAKSGNWDVAITGTAMVDVKNVVSVAKSGAWDVSISGTANVNVSNQVTARAYDQTDAVYNASTALTPKFAKVAENTAGAATLIAAVSGKKLRVLNAAVIGGGTAISLRNGTGSYLFGSGTAGQQVVLVAGSGFILPYSPVGWLETSAGDSLVIESSIATALAGTIVYVEV